MKKTGKRKPLFSLVEVMVVISIIAILVGIMTSALGSSVDGGKITDTRGEIAKVVLALNQYNLSNGDYPSFAGQLVDLPDLDKLQSYEQFNTVDAWGNELRYISHDRYTTNLSNSAKKLGVGAAATFYNHRSFQIVSAGKDGAFGSYPNNGELAITDQAADNIANFSTE